VGLRQALGEGRVRLAGVEVENGNLRLGAEALALLLDGVNLMGAKMRPRRLRG